MTTRSSEEQVIKEQQRKGQKERKGEKKTDKHYLLNVSHARESQNQQYTVPNLQGAISKELGGHTQQVLAVHQWRNI